MPLNSIKQEPDTEEENCNTDAPHPGEFIFVSCDNEHGKVTVKKERGSENDVEVIIVIMYS